MPSGASQVGLPYSMATREMACCVLTAYVMNRIIKACEILNLDIIKIQYNVFDDGPVFDTDAKSSNGPLLVSKFSIEGMTCSACITAVETAIKALEGIEAVSVSLPLSRASVAHYEDLISASDIVTAIEANGYGARHGLRTAQENFDLARHSEDLERQKNSFGNAVTLATVLSGIDSIRARVPQTSALYALLSFVQIPLGLWCQLVEAEWIHARAWRKGCFSSPNMDTLISLSLILGLGLSVLQTFLHGVVAEAVYWSSGSMLIAVVIGGRYIDTLLRRQAAHSVAQLYGLQSEAALVKVRRPPNLQSADHSTANNFPKPYMRVPAISLRPGDEICIDPGLIIPCDCYITSGSSIVDQATMTGESLPVNRSVGDFLMSGTRNLASELIAVVSKPQDESALEQLVSSVSVATEGPTAKGATDVLSSHFVRLLILISISCASYSYYSMNSAMPVSTRIIHAGERAMAILASACPCALGLAAPSAVMSGMSAAMSRGILIKGGFEAIQKLASLSHVVMDKTGTLTTGQLSVAAVTGSLDTAACMLICAAERADALTHPVARTVFQWALNEVDEEQRRAQHRLQVTDLHSEAGKGVSCTVTRPNTPSSIKVHIGTAAFLTEHSIPIPPPSISTSTMITTTTHNSAITVHIALSHTHTATLHLHDTLRPSAPLITRALQTHLNLSVTMLTGDSAAEAARVSAQLHDIPVLSSRALPHEKRDFVNALQQSSTTSRKDGGGGGGGGVAMVGDGLNDLPALAAADVGVLLAPGGLSRAATGTSKNTLPQADVVLATAELGRLVEAIVVARRTVAQVRWNRAWAVAYNVLAVGVAAGVAERWGVRVDARGAGMAMVGSSVSVVAWSLWFRRRLGDVRWERIVEEEEQI